MMVKFWRWLWIPHFAPGWVVLTSVGVVEMSWVHAVWALIAFPIIGLSGEYLFAEKPRP